MVFVLGLLSTNVNAGVPWRDDPVYTKALYIVAGVLSIGVGAGVGGVLGSMFTSPGSTICCARLADCQGSSTNASAGLVNPSDEDICKDPIDCSKWLNKYRSGCDAEKALLNQPTIIGVGVGAGVGVIGFTVFCLVKAFRKMPGEAQPLIGKPGEIV